MGFRYLGKDIENIVKSEPLAIEKALSILRVKLDVYADNMRDENNLYMEYNARRERSPKDAVEGDIDAVDRLVKENEEKEMKKKIIKRSKSHKRTKKGSVPKKRPKKKKSTVNTSSIPSKYKNIEDPYLELEKKDQIVNDLEDTIGILELKVSKLEQLVSLKEHKIEILESSLKDMMENTE